jgi:ATP/maltotriose-dependent transcriptional regulator MalT
VVAGRDEPPLRTARLRAQGRVLEIGPGDLSFTCKEAAWQAYSIYRKLDASSRNKAVTRVP